MFQCMFSFFCFLLALFRLLLRYYAFIGVIAPMNSALVRLHSRYNAFQFGVITPLFAFNAFFSHYYAFGVFFFSWSDTIGFRSFFSLAQIL